MTATPARTFVLIRAVRVKRFKNTAMRDLNHVGNDIQRIATMNAGVKAAIAQLLATARPCTSANRNNHLRESFRLSPSATGVSEGRGLGDEGLPIDSPTLRLTDIPAMGGEGLTRASLNSNRQRTR